MFKISFQDAVFHGESGDKATANADEDDRRSKIFMEKVRMSGFIITGSRILSGILVLSGS
jgi:hypothetical protein